MDKAATDPSNGPRRGPVTPREFGERLGVTPYTVRKRHRAGELGVDPLPRKNQMGRLLFPRAAVDRFLVEQGYETASGGAA